MKKTLLLSALAVDLLICAFTSKWEPLYDMPSPAQMVHIDSFKVIDPARLVSLTDPVCKMDIREHFADTTLVNGKLYGFCSTYCKKEFLKKMSKKSKVN